MNFKESEKQVFDNILKETDDLLNFQQNHIKTNDNTELLSDYQAGAAACFDGCAKAFIPILDNGTMESAMKMYRQLKGPNGGGLLGDLSGVARYISNMKYIGDDNSSEHNENSKSNDFSLPAIAKIVGELEDTLGVNKQLRRRSAEFNRGFMDCFNWLDSNLDSLMDDGSLEKAFKKYKELRGDAYDRHIEKLFMSLFTGEEVEDFDYGTFQDLVDIMNGSKTRFEESSLNKHKETPKLNEEQIFNKILNESEYSYYSDKPTLTVGQLIEELKKYPEDKEVELICFKESVCGTNCEGSGLVKSTGTNYGRVTIESYRKGYMG